MKAKLTGLFSRRARSSPCSLTATSALRITSFSLVRQESLPRCQSERFTTDVYEQQPSRSSTAGMLRRARRSLGDAGSEANSTFTASNSVRRSYDAFGGQVRQHVTEQKRTYHRAHRDDYQGHGTRQTSTSSLPSPPSSPSLPVSPSSKKGRPTQNASARQPEKAAERPSSQFEGSSYFSESIGTPSHRSSSTHSRGPATATTDSSSNSKGGHRNSNTFILKEQFQDEKPWGSRAHHGHSAQQESKQVRERDVISGRGFRSSTNQDRGNSGSSHCPRRTVRRNSGVDEKANGGSLSCGQSAFCGINLAQRRENGTSTPTTKTRKTQPLPHDAHLPLVNLPRNKSCKEDRIFDHYDGHTSSNHFFKKGNTGMFEKDTRTVWEFLMKVLPPTSTWGEGQVKSVFATGLGDRAASGARPNERHGEQGRDGDRIAVSRWERFLERDAIVRGASSQCTDTDNRVSRNTEEKGAVDRKGHSFSSKVASSQRRKGERGGEGFAVLNLVNPLDRKNASAPWQVVAKMILRYSALRYHQAGGSCYSATHEKVKLSGDAYVSQSHSHREQDAKQLHSGRPPLPPSFDNTRSATSPPLPEDSVLLQGLNSHHIAYMMNRVQFPWDLECGLGLVLARLGVLLMASGTPAVTVQRDTGGADSIGTCPLTRFVSLLHPFAIARLLRLSVQRSQDALSVQQSEHHLARRGGQKQGHRRSEAGESTKGGGGERGGEQRDYSNTDAHNNDNISNKEKGTMHATDRKVRSPLNSMGSLWLLVMNGKSVVSPHYSEEGYADGDSATTPPSEQKSPTTSAKSKNAFSSSSPPTTTTTTTATTTAASTFLRSLDLIVMGHDAPRDFAKAADEALRFLPPLWAYSLLLEGRARESYRQRDRVREEDTFLHIEKESETALQIQRFITLTGGPPPPPSSCFSSPSYSSNSQLSSFLLSVLPLSVRDVFSSHNNRLSDIGMEDMRTAPTKGEQSAAYKSTPSPSSAPLLLFEVESPIYLELLMLYLTYRQIQLSQMASLSSCYSEFVARLSSSHSPSHSQSNSPPNHSSSSSSSRPLTSGENKTSPAAATTSTTEENSSSFFDLDTFINITTAATCGQRSELIPDNGAPILFTSAISKTYAASASSNLVSIADKNSVVGSISIRGGDFNSKQRNSGEEMHTHSSSKASVADTGKPPLSIRGLPADMGEWYDLRLANLLLEAQRSTTTPKSSERALRGDRQTPFSSASSSPRSLSFSCQSVIGSDEALISAEASMRAALLLHCIHAVQYEEREAAARPFTDKRDLHGQAKSVAVAERRNKSGDTNSSSSSSSSVAKDNATTTAPLHVNTAFLPFASTAIRASVVLTRHWEESWSSPHIDDNHGENESVITARAGVGAGAGGVGSGSIDRGNNLSFVVDGLSSVGQLPMPKSDIAPSISAHCSETPPSRYDDRRRRGQVSLLKGISVHVAEELHELVIALAFHQLRHKEIPTPAAAGGVLGILRYGAGATPTVPRCLLLPESSGREHLAAGQGKACASSAMVSGLALDNGPLDLLSSFSGSNSYFRKVIQSRFTEKKLVLDTVVCGEMCDNNSRISEDRWEREGDEEESLASARDNQDDESVAGGLGLEESTVKGLGSQGFDVATSGGGKDLALVGGHWAEAMKFVEIVRRLHEFHEHEQRRLSRAVGGGPMNRQSQALGHQALAFVPKVLYGEAYLVGIVSALEKVVVELLMMGYRNNDDNERAAAAVAGTTHEARKSADLSTKGERDDKKVEIPNRNGIATNLANSILANIEEWLFQNVFKTQSLSGIFGGEAPAIQREGRGGCVGRAVLPPFSHAHKGSSFSSSSIMPSQSTVAGTSMNVNRRNKEVCFDDTFIFVEQLKRHQRIIQESRIIFGAVLIEAVYLLAWCRHHYNDYSSDRSYLEGRQLSSSMSLPLAFYTYDVGHGEKVTYTTHFVGKNSKTIKINNEEKEERRYQRLRNSVNEIYDAFLYGEESSKALIYEQCRSSAPKRTQQEEASEENGVRLTNIERGKEKEANIRMLSTSQHQAVMTAIRLLCSRRETSKSFPPAVVNSRVVAAWESFFSSRNTDDKNENNDVTKEPVVIDECGDAHHGIYTIESSIGVNKEVLADFFNSPELTRPPEHLIQKVMHPSRISAMVDLPQSLFASHVKCEERAEIKANPKTLALIKKTKEPLSFVPSSSGAGIPLIHLSCNGGMVLGGGGGKIKYTNNNVGTNTTVNNDMLCLHMLRVIEGAQRVFGGALGVDSSLLFYHSSVTPLRERGPSSLVSLSSSPSPSPPLLGSGYTSSGKGINTPLSYPSYSLSFISSASPPPPPRLEEAFHLVKRMLESLVYHRYLELALAAGTRNGSSSGSAGGETQRGASPPSRSLTASSGEELSSILGVPRLSMPSSSSFISRGAPRMHRQTSHGYISEETRLAQTESVALIMKHCSPRQLPLFIRDYVLAGLEMALGDDKALVLIDDERPPAGGEEGKVEENNRQKGIPTRCNNTDNNNSGRRRKDVLSSYFHSLLSVELCLMALSRLEEAMPAPTSFSTSAVKNNTVGSKNFENQQNKNHEEEKAVEEELEERISTSQIDERLGQRRKFIEEKLSVATSIVGVCFGKKEKGDNGGTGGGEVRGPSSSGLRVPHVIESYLSSLRFELIELTLNASAALHDSPSLSSLLDVDELIRSFISSVNSSSTAKAATRSRRHHGGGDPSCAGSEEEESQSWEEGKSLDRYALNSSAPLFLTEESGDGTIGKGSNSRLHGNSSTNNVKQRPMMMAIADNWLVELALRGLLDYGGDRRSYGSSSNEMVGENSGVDSARDARQSRGDTKGSAGADTSSPSKTNKTATATRTTNDGEAHSHQPLPLYKQLVSCIQDAYRTILEPLQIRGKGPAGGKHQHDTQMMMMVAFVSNSHAEISSLTKRVFVLASTLLALIDLGAVVKDYSRTPPPTRKFLKKSTHGQSTAPSSGILNLVAAITNCAVASHTELSKSIISLFQRESTAHCSHGTTGQDHREGTTSSSSSSSPTFAFGSPFHFGCFSSEGKVNGVTPAPSLPCELLPLVSKDVLAGALEFNSVHFGSLAGGDSNSPKAAAKEATTTTATHFLSNRRLEKEGPSPEERQRSSSSSFPSSPSFSSSSSCFILPVSVITSSTLNSYYALLQSSMERCWQAEQYKYHYTQSYYSQSEGEGEGEGGAATMGNKISCGGGEEVKKKNESKKKHINGGGEDEEQAADRSMSPLTSSPSTTLYENGEGDDVGIYTKKSTLLALDSSSSSSSSLSLLTDITSTHSNNNNKASNNNNANEMRPQIQPEKLHALLIDATAAGVGKQFWYGNGHHLHDAKEGAGGGDTHDGADRNATLIKNGVGTVTTNAHTLSGDKGGWQQQSHEVYATTMRITDTILEVMRNTTSGAADQGPPATTADERREWSETHSHIQQLPFSTPSPSSSSSTSSSSLSYSHRPLLQVLRVYRRILATVPTLAGAMHHHEYNHRNNNQRLMPNDDDDFPLVNEANRTFLTEKGTRESKIITNNNNSNNKVGEKEETALYSCNPLVDDSRRVCSGYDDDDDSLILGEDGAYDDELIDHNQLVGGGNGPTKREELQHRGESEGGRRHKQNQPQQQGQEKRRVGLFWPSSPPPRAHDVAFAVFEAVRDVSMFVTKSSSSSFSSPRNESSHGDSLLFLFARQYQQIAYEIGIKVSTLCALSAPLPHPSRLLSVPASSSPSPSPYSSSSSSTAVSSSSSLLSSPTTMRSQSISPERTFCVVSEWLHTHPSIRILRDIRRHSLKASTSGAGDGTAANSRRDGKEVNGGEEEEEKTFEISDSPAPVAFFPGPSIVLSSSGSPRLEASRAAALSSRLSVLSSHQSHMNTNADYCSRRNNTNYMSFMRFSKIFDSELRVEVRRRQQQQHQQNSPRRSNRHQHQHQQQRQERASSSTTTTTANDNATLHDNSGPHPSHPHHEAMGLARDLRSLLDVYDDAIQTEREYNATKLISADLSSTAHDLFAGVGVVNKKKEGSTLHANTSKYVEKYPRILPFWVTDLGKKANNSSSFSGGGGGAAVNTTSWGLTRDRCVLFESSSSFETVRESLLSPMSHQRGDTFVRREDRAVFEDLLLSEEEEGEAKEGGSGKVRGSGVDGANLFNEMSTVEGDVAANCSSAASIAHQLSLQREVRSMAALARRALGLVLSLTIIDSLEDGLTYELQEKRAKLQREEEQLLNIMKWRGAKRDGSGKDERPFNTATSSALAVWGGGAGGGDSPSLSILSTAAITAMVRFCAVHFPEDLAMPGMRLLLNHKIAEFGIGSLRHFDLSYLLSVASSAEAQRKSMDLSWDERVQRALQLTIMSSSGGIKNDDSDDAGFLSSSGGGGGGGYGDGYAARRGLARGGSRHQHQRYAEEEASIFTTSPHDDQHGRTNNSNNNSSNSKGSDVLLVPNNSELLVSFEDPAELVLLRLSLGLPLPTSLHHAGLFFQKDHSVVGAAVTSSNFYSSSDTTAFVLAEVLSAVFPRSSPETYRLLDRLRNELILNNNSNNPSSSALSRRNDDDAYYGNGDDGEYNTTTMSSKNTMGLDENSFSSSLSSLSQSTDVVVAGGDNQQQPFDSTLEILNNPKYTTRSFDEGFFSRGTLFLAPSTRVRISAVADNSHHLPVVVAASAAAVLRHGYRPHYQVCQRSLWRHAVAVLVPLLCERRSRSTARTPLTSTSSTNDAERTRTRYNAGYTCDTPGQRRRRSDGRSDYYFNDDVTCISGDGKGGRLDRRDGDIVDADDSFKLALSTTLLPHRPADGHADGSSDEVHSSTVSLLPRTMSSSRSSSSSSSSSSRGAKRVESSIKSGHMVVSGYSNYYGPYHHYNRVTVEDLSDQTRLMAEEADAVLAGLQSEWAVVRSKRRSRGNTLSSSYITEKEVIAFFVQFPHCWRIGLWLFADDVVNDGGDEDQQCHFTSQRLRAIREGLAMIAPRWPEVLDALMDL